MIFYDKNGEKMEEIAKEVLEIFKETFGLDGALDSLLC